VPTVLERIRSGEFPVPPIAETLGFRLIAIDVGRGEFAMEADVARHGNPMGTVHGGVLCDLADAAMGMAFASTLEEGESFTTLELKINFLRPVWRTTLTAVGEVVQRGRTVGLTACRVTDEAGRLVAQATSTCLVLRGEQAAGR
jgi:uncharacterized protein (TIGR00369 family)